MNLFIFIYFFVTVNAHCLIFCCLLFFCVFFFTFAIVVSVAQVCLPAWEDAVSSVWVVAPALAHVRVGVLES